MAKKTDKAVKDLAKEIKKLRKGDEQLAKTLEKIREDQAEAHREILALLQERPTAADADADAGADVAEYRGILDEDGAETEPVATIAEGGDGETVEASPEVEDGREEPEITDAAKRRAKELSVDLSGVKGTGSGGRVLVKDVEAAAGQ